MALDNKYRVHEVAKDLGLSTKEISDILTAFSAPPKNHMQVLEEAELNCIFEHVTQQRQVADIESTLAAQAATTPVAPTAENSKPVQTPVATPVAPKATTPAANTAPVAPKSTPVQSTATTPATAAADGTTTDPIVPASKGKQVHRIDTRGGGDINLAKYDDRIEKLVTDKAERMDSAGGKQKLTKKSDQRNKPFGNKRRQEEQEKFKRLQRQQQMAALKKIPVKVMIPDEITVGELASRMKKTSAEVIKGLMKLGVMATITETIDFDTAAIIAEELGAKVEKEVHVTIEERLFDEREDAADELTSRDPVVVVMGHVDHGKTSLLDAIRKTKVTEGEAGGITQHIGAYRVQIDGKPITFLDTPGHSAFTSMRARGAQITDIAILVVAADDGIMPQTIEAINHAKAANIPIIVAVNKIDKEGANADRIMQQLTEYELVPEEWGGQTIVCQISAKFGKGIENLLEMVLLTAEVADLKANPNRQAKGTVIEAKLDKGRGPVATVLIQNGTLHAGDIIIAGTAVGRVRAMTNDDGTRIENAGPSVPVEIIGLADVPNAGDICYAVDDEKMARELAEQRRHQEKTERYQQLHKVTLDNLFESIQDGQMKELPLIVKGDVQGSVEAIRASLMKLTNEEVRVRVIHCGVGAINETDVMLADASGAIIVGFNVRPDRTAAESAEIHGVDMRMYRIIYDAISEIEQAMKGMLEPKFKEVILGHAEVRQVFKITGAGAIAGCYVQDGKIQRNAQVRVVRDGIVFHEGVLNTLKRFKDDQKEVAANYECGMSIENYDNIKEGDIIECFLMEQIKV